MNSTVVKVVVGVIGLAVGFLLVSDSLKQSKMKKAGKTEAHAACIAKGESAATCTAFVKTRHDACWKMSFRPSMSTRTSQGAAAHLDQATYADCILRSPDVVGAEAAKRREDLRRQAAERNNVLR